MQKQCVTIETALAVMAISRRTLWRRITEGAIAKCVEAPAGGGAEKCALDAGDVLRQIFPSLPEVDADLLCAADAGDAQAQNDLALALHAAERSAQAVFWWQRAAQGGNADAMQWLGRAYLLGEHLPEDQSLALMWLDKAAAAGHVIARELMCTLMDLRLRALQAPAGSGM